MVLPTFFNLHLNLAIRIHKVKDQPLNVYQKFISMQEKCLSYDVIKKKKKMQSYKHIIIFVLLVLPKVVSLSKQK